MATRFYLPSTSRQIIGVPQIANPPFTTNGVRASMVTLAGKVNSPLTDQVLGFGAGPIAIRQFLSPPIGVVNFNATTVSAIVNTAQVTATLNTEFSLRLLHPATNTFSDIITAGAGGNNWTTSKVTHIPLNAVACNNVTSTAGDIIVYEIGSAAATGSGNLTMRWGDPVGTGDFALTDGLVTDLCCWLEFSATITFVKVAGSGRLFIEQQARNRAALW